MKRDDFDLVRDLFDELLTYPERRSRLLRKLGTLDVSLRTRLEDLLAAHARDGCLDRVAHRPGEENLAGSD